MKRIAIDHVPKLVRPLEVERAIEEARELHERHRRAQEQLASAEQALDQALEDDVTAQAKRVRDGAEPGALPPTLEQAKRAVELAQRNARAIGLASEQAEQDVVSAIGELADAWVVALRAEAENARQTGYAALVAIADAFTRIGGSASAELWLAGAINDGRYDRPPKPIAAFARSSLRRTANGEPLSVGDLLAYLQEAIEQQTPGAAALVEIDTGLA